MRAVAVSGIGVVSPLGSCCAEVFDRAVGGRSAIRLRPGEAVPVAEAPFEPDRHFEPPQQRMLDRVSQFALVAARQALADAGDVLDGVDRGAVGVFVGTGMGGTLTLDEGYRRLYGEGSDHIKPATILAGMHNAPAAWIALEHRFGGPNLSYSTACSSSAVAIGEACLRVARGDIEVAVAGGSEAPLSPGSLQAWRAMHTLAPADPLDPAASCKPFSADRCGMVLGEGAALLVLEPLDRALARGARLRGTVLGYGLVTDCSHLTRPSVEGQAQAMRAALRSAGLAPQDFDAINAHGTGTPANDAVETAAIRAVFGAHAERLPISATKAMHGHLLGAAGALEAVLALLAMAQSVALPTLHLSKPDPACDLDYVPNVARLGVPARAVLSSSFAFGGTNAVLALGARP